MHLFEISSHSYFGNCKTFYTRPTRLFVIEYRSTVFRRLWKWYENEIIWSKSVKNEKKFFSNCCSGFQNKWIKNIMACCIDDNKDDNVIIKWLNQKERFFCPLKRVLWFNDFLRFRRMNCDLLVGEKENAYLVICAFFCLENFSP